MAWHPLQRSGGTFAFSLGKGWIKRQDSLRSVMPNVRHMDERPLSHAAQGLLPA